MGKKFFITTPIYYVNDEPHLGHAYSSIIADILARFHRLFGHEVFFLTGTDEHGQKVAEAAAEAGRTPQEHCDLMVKRFQTVWDKMNLSNDDFIRTTEVRHKSKVQEILQQLWDAGEIYEDEYKGWYCVPEERFWTEKDLVDGNCPVCGREVQQLTEKNYFFRMSKYQDWLIEHIKSNPRFILPESRRNEILGFLSNPLGDLCISRPKKRLAWGIPLPFDENFVTYVWFDALFNYYTSPLSLDKDCWPTSVHLIGKDILTTHCVYWPTMLKATGIELPETIFGHGWWLFEDVKMSKSLGNVVKPLELADRYGVDAFRFFVAREMSLGMDASFSEEALVKRYNSELANDLGNLFSRLLKLVNTFCEGKIPARESDVYSEEKSEIDAIRPFSWRELEDKIERLDLNAALNDIMAYLRGINKFIENAAPWKTGKTDPEGTKNILRVALEGLAWVAYLLWPVMPDKMGEILVTLGIDDPQSLPEDTVAKSVKAGKEIPAKASLFPRVKFKPLQEESVPVIPEEELLSIEEFKRLKLKIARVIKAEPVPNADKLLKLEIDLGSESRQLVAGIAEYYSPDDLIGKLIVVVANLKPARIRGIESNGMLLAAEDKSRPVIIIPEGEAAPGSDVS